MSELRRRERYMRSPFPGIGIVFDIDELGDSHYGYSAWKLFTKHLDPRRLGVCILVEGDTAATLRGRANEFCIGIYGSDLAIDYVRRTFEDLNEPGLAAFHRRFIEKISLDYQPMVIYGQIDALNRLVQDDWNRMDHELCKEAGWGYYPRNVPSDLESALLIELEELRRPCL